MPVDRELPSDEARAIVGLARDLAERELKPRAAEHEERGEFPREVFRLLGEAGLLGLTYPVGYGGGAQPYTVYLQVLEELAAGWAAVALGVSVQSLAAYPVAEFGTEEQRRDLLPAMLDGSSVGAYCLSETQSGSDAAGLQTRAVRDGDDYVLDGTKAWVTHGGVADFYNVFCRTGEHRTRGISTLLVPADTPGLVPQPPRSPFWPRRAPP